MYFSAAQGIFIDGQKKLQKKPIVDIKISYSYYYC
jgi:hypothetical protein